MSNEIADWESEGGAIDPSPGVVMVLPKGSLDDPEFMALVREAKRERVRVEVVSEETWRGWLRMFEAMDELKDGAND